MPFLKEGKTEKNTQEMLRELSFYYTKGELHLQKQ